MTLQKWSFIKFRCNPGLNEMELFAKLHRMATIAPDLFVGRERFATLLLTRLTETVILWLSEDQSFWEDIEDGPRPLAPLGLLQFYLDMKFAVLFSTQNRFPSRQLNQVIREIIERAVAAFSATGIDPNRGYKGLDLEATMAQKFEMMELMIKNSQTNNAGIPEATCKESVSSVVRDIGNPSHLIRASNITDNLEGKKAILINMEKVQVAVGVVISYDPDKIVMGRKIGNDLCQVTLTQAYKPDTGLFIEDEKMKTIKDAIGSYVLWWKDYVLICQL